MQRIRNRALLIAGLDPSAGAGLGSDIITLNDHGVESVHIISANTIQHDERFIKLKWEDPSWMKEQILLLSEKFSFPFVKIGLIENYETLHAVIDTLFEINNDVKIIWDPIIQASTGFDFHEWRLDNLVQLLDKIYLITPNKSEFEIFTNTTFNLKQILSKSFLYNYYIKTVNDTSSTITDLLIEENTYTEFFNTKLNSKYLKHGSGCVLSASITANLMNGHDLKTAIKFANKYLALYLQSSESFIANRTSAKRSFQLQTQQIHLNI